MFGLFVDRCIDLTCAALVRAYGSMGAKDLELMFSLVFSNFLLMAWHTEI